MSFSEANKLYRDGRYKEALNIYYKLAEIFGSEIVSINIENCKKRISESSLHLHSNEQKKLEIALSQIEQDSTTKILQDNVRTELDTVVRNKLLNELNERRTIQSENAEVKDVNPVPKEWPIDLHLFPLPESTNDYEWYAAFKKLNSVAYVANACNIGLSIIVPTFNRSKILTITLMSLVNQQSKYPFEVIVADDGSQESIANITRIFEDKLDIKYVRQKDYGYQLCAVRNLGIRTAKYGFVAILDCDMAANPYWVNSYIEALINNDDIAFIGPRKYIDTNNLNEKNIYENLNIFEELPPVKSDSISTAADDGVSKDWRLEHFKQTDNLRLCDSPFRYFSGGNVAFAKKWLDKAGWFDEEFTHWGGEDNEFGYRLYKMGCFFKALEGAMAYHQEPPGKENETDRLAGQAITRKIIEQKVPYFYRKLEPIETATIKRVPLVSIYIPAYNCEKSIIRCVESALNQTISDLEVCICNDGSTDRTLEVLELNYNNHPRVRFITQENGGIAKASNNAVKLCRGYYIGQLDSDDYLEPNAVELCLKEFFKDKALACVYTTNRNVDENGNLISNGYNWPVFSREKFSTAMIVHHFRMFTIRAWNLTTGFDEKIENAVDYDMYLKLSEVGKFKHINRICYNRVLHGENTSIKKLGIQKKNHFKVVNNALKRQGIENYKYNALENDDSSRKFSFKKSNNSLLIASSYESNNTKLVEGSIHSIVYPEKLDKLLNQLANIVEYNTKITLIIIHCDKQYVTVDIEESIKLFIETKKIEVILNYDLDYIDYKYRKAEYHYSNFKLATSKNIQSRFFIFEDPNTLYILPDAYSHITKYEVGSQSGLISGYWKERILQHRVLNQFIQEEISEPINQLNIKGTIYGMFLDYSIVNQVFDVIKILLDLCESSGDFPQYMTDEIWFNLAILILEKRKGSKFKRTTTLTYLPWDRNLLWSECQIADAKIGKGIQKNKFSINGVFK